MTNAELLAKIKAEIERLYNDRAYSEDRWDLGYDCACEDMMSFLFDLESEKPTNLETLEEDVKSWFFNEISSKINVEHTMYYYFQECARRYAQWGAEHAKEIRS